VVIRSCDIKKIKEYIRILFEKKILISFSFEGKEAEETMGKIDSSFHGKNSIKRINFYEFIFFFLAIFR
jgi:hypothetical protein